MVDVRKALNQYTLSNFGCYYSRPVYDPSVKYLMVPVYRTWQKATASIQPQGLGVSLDEMFDAVDGSFDFWFPTENIIYPRADDVFFIQNVGYFAVNSVDNWQETGGEYLHISATYRPSHIITDAGGEVDFSLKTPLLPKYINPYTRGGMLDRVLMSHWECFDLLYKSNRKFFVSDQDVRRFPCYSVLRFVDQDQIMHPIMTNGGGASDLLLCQSAESNYNIKVMLSFWGGQALQDRNLWETAIFHEKLMDIWEKYGIGITDDWYPENLTDTDQNRRLQKSRTSYTVNVVNSHSFNYDKVKEIKIGKVSVFSKS